MTQWRAWQIGKAYLVGKKVSKMHTVRGIVACDIFCMSGQQCVTVCDRGRGGAVNFVKKCEIFLNGPCTIIEVSSYSRSRRKKVSIKVQLVDVHCSLNTPVHKVHIRSFLT